MVNHRDLGMLPGGQALLRSVKSYCPLGFGKVQGMEMDLVSLWYRFEGEENILHVVLWLQWKKPVSVS